MTEQLLSETLNRLGFSTASNGYNYVFNAILLAIEHPIKSFPITQKMYPYIAQKYNVTSASVEKSIRVTIAAAWHLGDSHFITEIFRNSIPVQKSRPTNLQFIKTIAEYVRLEILLTTKNYF